MVRHVCHLGDKRTIGGDASVPYGLSPTTITHGLKGGPVGMVVGGRGGGGEEKRRRGEEEGGRGGEKKSGRRDGVRRRVGGGDEEGRQGEG